MAVQHGRLMILPEKDVEMLLEDQAVARRLLTERGLLIDLPESTFQRWFGLDRTHIGTAQILSGQISRYNRTKHYTTAAMTTVKQIRYLASLNWGPFLATGLLVDAAEEYLYQNTLHNDHLEPGEDPHEIDAEIDAMDELMDELVRAQYAAARESQESCNPLGLSARIEELIKPIKPGGVSWLGYNEHEVKHLFKNSLRLVRIFVARRAAEIAVLKVAGHWLPVELVDIITDLICSGKELKENGRQGGGQWMSLERLRIS